MKYLYIFLLIPLFALGQTSTENYVMTSDYKIPSKGDYNNFSQSIGSTELFINGSGGGSGSIGITNNILTLNFSGSLSASSNRLKEYVKGLVASPPLPDMELGPIITTAAYGSLPTGYNAKIINNYLIFYSAYFIKSIGINLSKNITPTNLTYAISTGSLHACPTGSGGSSGYVSIANGIITFTGSGTWTDMCNLKTGQIAYLNTVSLPNIELGTIKTNTGLDTAYNAKIENNWLVIYSTQDLQPPSSVSMNVSIDLNVGSENKKVEITYFDGLGRPKQTIKARMGGNNQDVITPILYDNDAKQTKEYLPYAYDGLLPGTSSLGYRNNTTLVNSINNLYLNLYPGDFSSAQPNPYIEKRFDSAANNRLLEQGAPGDRYKLNPASDSDHTLKFEYKFNSASDKIKFYQVTYSGSTPTLTDTGYYNVNSLYKYVTKNENWVPNQFYPDNNTSIEFKDKKEKLVLKRTINDNKWHDTYYVYDSFGNLCFALPPLMDTYPSSQIQWPEYFSNTDNDFSYYPATHYSENNTSGISFSEDGAMTFYLSDTSGPATPLKTGLVKNLNLPAVYPDVILGPISIMVNTNGTFENTHYNLVLQNGNLYITGDGTIAYGVFADVSYNFGNYEGNLGTINTNTLNALAYQYRYDSKRRQIQKKLPGKAWEYVVYDNLDRPVLTQNANLRGQTSEFSLQSQNKWVFTKYDAYGRKVMTGIWTNPILNQTRSQIQDIYDSATIFSEQRSGTSVTLSGTNVYYTNDALPNTNLELLSIHYYDSYVDNAGLLPEVSYGITPITKAQSLETVSKIAVGSPNPAWITTANYYDVKGRQIYSVKKNDFLNSTDKLKSKYDFSGNIIESEERHLRSFGEEIVMNNKFTFNNNNKLLTHKQTINNTPEELILKNIYDSRGNLIQKRVGNTETNPLQIVDYTYNSRGWLKSMNNVNRMGSDVFALDFSYEEHNGAPVGQYTGNISHSYWRVDNPNSKLKHYNYQYDGLGRLTRANYAENNSVQYNSKFAETVGKYDRNGNILSLKRNAQNPDNPDGLVNIDDLQYTYSGNKVTAVVDNLPATSNSQKGFNDFNTVGSDYIYDVSGNLIKDKNKQINTSITYNHLDLPTLITFDNGSSIKFVYDGLGNRQSKVFLPEGMFLGTTTEYIGKFIYKKSLLNTPVLQLITHPEGYIARNANVYSYIYQYKDNLNNVRATYTDANHDGDITTATSEIFYDGFENSGGWTSLNSVAGGQLTAIDATRAHSGKFSGRITKTTAGELFVHSNRWIPIANAQPTEYILSGWVYSDNPSVDLYLVAKKANETTYPVYLYNVSTSTRNSWIYLERKITILSDAVALNVRIDNNGGGNVWFDDINIRKVENTATVEIIQENSYYPFGLKHEDMSPYSLFNGNATAQLYRYNGKEWQEEQGLNLYDYGGRNYDPALGRWLNSDPSAEKTRRWSPYNYAFNNPLRFIDPDGNSPYDIVINMFDLATGKYREYARIKSDLYDFNINMGVYPMYPVSRAADTSQRRTYGDFRGISGRYKFDEMALAHGNPDAISLSVGLNGAFIIGKGYSLSATLMLRGPDKGKAGLYKTSNDLTGLEASLGLQASFMYSDVAYKDFNLSTMEGYAEGVQAGASIAGGSMFRSYSGKFVDVKNEGDWFSHEEFKKTKLLYHGFSYGLGIGPEDVTVSASMFIGMTTFLFELTNMYQETKK